MVAWPLVPNWTQPVRETLEFRTEIFTSRDGTETRRALRSTPRRSLEYTALVADDRVRSLERLLVRNHKGTFRAAELTRGVRLTGALPVDGTSVTVGSVPEWLIADAQIMVSAGLDARLFTVDSITDLTVTFTAASDLAFSAGARLSPTAEGRIAASLSTTRPTGQLAAVPVAFEPLPGTEPPDEGSVDFAAVFDDREVFTLTPDWSTAPAIEFTYEAERIDYGRGRIAVFDPVAFGTRIQQATYLNRSADDARALMQFFVRMKGQRGEFYCPTWTHDLPPAADLTADGDTLIVAGSEVFDTYAEDTVHRALVVRTALGDVPMRIVTSITLVEGDSVITLTEPWGYDIPVSAIVSVSWMPLCRFASDSLTIEWVTDELARATVPIRTLSAGEPEVDLTGDLDGAALWLLSTFGWIFTESVLYDPLQWAVNVRYPQIAEIE